MKLRRQTVLSLTAVIGILTIALLFFGNGTLNTDAVRAAADPTPTPAPAGFDQAAAIAKLKEQIKGHEQEPASTVFKNIQMMKTTPAARLLAIMELGYARSLGVDCTHCHIPDKWESEERVQKHIARDMSAMAGKINNELLAGIKNLKSEKPTINCTTCHRGQVKPALNLPQPPKT